MSIFIVCASPISATDINDSQTNSDTNDLNFETNIDLNPIVNNDNYRTEEINSVNDKYSISNISSMANSVNNYVEKNKKLPDYVSFGNNNLSMDEFSYLVSKATVQLNNNNFADISLFPISKPSYPIGDNVKGNLYKADC